MPELNYDQTVARLTEIADEMRRVHAKDEATPEDHDYFLELGEEADELRSHKDKFEREAILKGLNVKTGRKVHVESADEQMDADPFGEPGSAGETRGFRNPWDLSEIRSWGKSPEEIGGELRARALSAVEQMRGTTPKRRERMTEILETSDTADGHIARLALATSSPDYLRAFWKVAKYGQSAMLTDGEKAAVQRMQNEQRAMSLTDAAGGYLVPFQLDPTVIITSDGSLNQIRQAARQVVATGDVWNGVSSTAVSFSWDAEAAEVSDDATTFAQPSIPVYKGAGFVPISIEAFQDEANVASEVGRLLAFGKDTLEATAFATGTGSAQPTGIVTAITGEATGSATTDTFALADVYTIEGALPARYRPRASWLANNKIYNLIRQFDTAGGAGLWERVGADRPAELLGRPAYEAEGMDGVINATADNYVLIFGDFSNYVIADRVGMSVELIPHLFATGNNRPSGQRGWYAFFRVGADSVNDSAFEILNVT